MFSSLLSYIKNLFHNRVECDEEQCIPSDGDGYLNANMSILQGMYIRDKISEEYIMNNLFIKKLNMKIVSHVWNINTDYYDMYSQSTEMQKRMENYIDEKIANLDNNEVNLVYIRMPSHINGIYVDLRDRSPSTSSSSSSALGRVASPPDEMIDHSLSGCVTRPVTDKRSNLGKKYYLYEPHIPSKHHKEYPLLQYITTSFEKKDIIKQDLPPYVLKQKSLPLCYMYVLHLFIYLYMIDNKLIEYKNIQCANDTEIMDFTRFIVDQCFECDMIESEDYYLLTNRICQYNLLPNKKFDCKFIFLRSCNPDVMLSFFQNNEKLRIDFTQIKTLHDDVNFYYIIDFIERIENDNISQFNAHQIILLILILKHCFGYNFSQNINQWFDKIEEDTLVDAIKESDILTIFYEYNFYIAILNLIKSNKNKKEVINRVYYDSDKKTNCPNRLLKLITCIHKSNDDNIEYVGMRRDRTY